MNYYISIVFRAIPLFMGIICFTTICIAFFTTAATIIRQL